MKSGGCVFLLEHRYDTPFGSKIHKDRLDSLDSIANVVAIEFSKVHGITSFTGDFVDDDGIDALLFPVFLTL